MTDPLQSNSYAVAYRLMGVRPAARHASTVATERVRERFRREGGLEVAAVPVENWLPMLIDFTVDEAVSCDPSVLPADENDEFAGLRHALRRRLDRASRSQRVVGALVHLCGYSVDDVALMLDMDQTSVVASSQILAPPPGIDYRDLGDPQLTGRARTASAEPPRSRLPHPSTIIVAAVLLILAILATRCHGPRPTLVDEGSMIGSQHSSEMTHSVHADIGQG